MQCWAMGVTFFFNCFAWRRVNPLPLLLLSVVLFHDQAWIRFVGCLAFGSRRHGSLQRKATGQFNPLYLIFRPHSNILPRG